MKRIILTLAFLMAMAFCASAQTDLFFKWNDADNDLYRANDNLGFALQPHTAPFTIAKLPSVADC